MIFLTFVRVCVLLMKMRWRRLPEDRIRFSPPSPCHGDASSRYVSVRSIFDGFAWICTSFVYVYVSSGWILSIYTTLQRQRLPQRLLDCHNKFCSAPVREGRWQRRLRLASILVVVTRWSTDLGVSFITFEVHWLKMNRSIVFSIKNWNHFSFF